jgi:hypothetical protein
MGKGGCTSESVKLRGKIWVNISMDYWSSSVYHVQESLPQVYEKESERRVTPTNC